MIRIKESKYKGTECLILENDYLSLTLIPYGARVVSFFDKTAQKEFLMQQDEEKYMTGKYDSDYVSAGPCGFDDMFPTIVRSYYPDYPWEGTLLPDHGEVWALPWEYCCSDSEIKIKVNGVRIPYTLEKTFKIIGDKDLRIDYRVINRSDFNMKFAWAAHPMIVAEKDMEFNLPLELDNAISVLNGSSRTGGYGNIFKWKELITQKINIFGSPAKGNVEKYYFLEKVKNGYIDMKYPSTGTILSMKFPSDTVPYIGILIDEGSWKKDTMFIIPEPCTSPMDRIDIADLYGKCSEVDKNSIYHWWLSLSIKESLT